MKKHFALGMASVLFLASSSGTLALAADPKPSPKATTHDLFESVTGPISDKEKEAKRSVQKNANQGGDEPGATFKRLDKSLNEGAAKIRGMFMGDKKDEKKEPEEKK